MKQYSIKITGDGTLDQLEDSLKMMLARMNFEDEPTKNYTTTKRYEDPFIHCEIAEE